MKFKNYKRKNIHKKGSVELSLNLIIMLIIGMVVLGLVIGFVNNLVNKGTKSFDTQLGDNEKLKLEEVSRCSNNLCMIPEPSITVQKGGKQNVFIKVRAFDTDIQCTAGTLDPSGGCGVGYEVLDNSGNANTDIKLSGPGFTAKQGEEDAQMYTLLIDKSVPIGTYYLTLQLYPSSADKVTKTITINVE